ncbi:MAG TPA: DUF998 domain-containing protein [Acidimicrobiales bacterium]|nr:DUF998 domain-containing protein [Acidimicrobiales bacterium]
MAGRDLPTRALLACGLAAGPVFVMTYVVDGRTRRHYQPRRHPVSALALGSRGWVQVANFLVTGPLTVAAAVGLGRVTRHGPGRAVMPAAVAAAGLGLIGAGLFATDPVPGYPDPASPAPAPRSAPGARRHRSSPAAVTRTGALHIASSVPFFVGFPVAELAGAGRLARQGRRVGALLSAAAAVTGTAAVTVAGAGFAGKEGVADRAGTWQRLSVVTAFSWLAAMSGRALAAAP